MNQTFRTHLAWAAQRLILAKRAATTIAAVMLIAFGAWADNGYNYIGADGQPRNTFTDDGIPDASITLLNGSVSEERTEISQEEGCVGWYVVTGKVTYNAGLFIEGHNDDVNLILCDDAELSLSGYDCAFGFNGFHFNLYGQTNGTGKIVTKVVTNNPVCGISASVSDGDGYSWSPGSFTIYGGVIEANGDDYGLYISGGDFIVNGGSVKATGYIYGIDTSSHQFTINGGSVEAISSNNIGIYADEGTVIINGGDVNAQGTKSGINAGDNGSVTINGGSVIVSGGNYGICAYTEEKVGGTVEIEGGTVTASGDNTGIYAYGEITISGGTVEATGNSVGIFAGSEITISGGIVKASGENSCGIMNSEGDITISGGCITATGEDGFYAGDGYINLDWTYASDFITSSSIIAMGRVIIAEGKVFTDGANTYSSKSESLEALKSEITLRPLLPTFTLNAKVATINEGQTDESTNYWTTFYCGDTGYIIDDGVSACAYTATLSGSEITLNRLGRSIPAGTAVIIAADGSGETVDVTMTMADLADFEGLNDLHGVDMATSRTSLLSTYSADAILMLSNKNSHFGFHDVELTNIPARKAFLPINDPSGAREFRIMFDDATGIKAIDRSGNAGRTMGEKAGAWYMLDGRRLSGKPAMSGIYVKNGKKIVIK